MIELELLEESICDECEHPCTYHLYVYIRGYDRDLYQEERCDKLLELNNDNQKSTLNPQLLYFLYNPNT